jgi:hypothetical protein
MTKNVSYNPDLPLLTSVLFSWSSFNEDSSNEAFKLLKEYLFFLRFLNIIYIYLCYNLKAKSILLLKKNKKKKLGSVR